MLPTLQKLRQSVRVNAPANQVYEALLDSATLSRIFGRPVQASGILGGAYSHFGRIHGHNLELEPGRRIVQTFRYARPEWPLEHLSRVTIQLTPVPEGTRLVLHHSGIPPTCAPAVEEHWKDHVLPGLKSIVESRVPQRKEASAGMRVRQPPRLLH